MTQKAVLVIENGSYYEGESFGASGTTFGETVFITGMTGYQEMLTDPSFAGQIVVPTYPLIGNYGINKHDIESSKIQVRGFVVREYCTEPSHWQCITPLHDYLKECNIQGLAGIDTRKLTRQLRSKGVMKGILTTELTVSEAINELRKIPDYGSTDFVRQVATTDSYRWAQSASTESMARILILDMGLRFNIAHILRKLNCDITVMPCTASIEDILNYQPDGIVLSPGPGNPALLDYLVDTIKFLADKIPILGICLGHQLIGKAFGANTYKLKFGHRGSNHPVRDIATGRIYITTQNHGYAIDAETLKGGLYVSHINLNDGSVEGMRHRELPIMTIQYHAEGSPGPHDSMHIFDNFIAAVIKSKKE